MYIYICVYCHFIGKLTKPVDLLGFTAPYLVRHDFWIPGLTGACL